MRKADVEIGGRYHAKVTGKVVVVRILRERTYGGGWEARNEETGRPVTIRSAQRLRGKAEAVSA